ncbi:MAG: protein phosphatase [Firmicutes bacterium]|nr:protein phosphatase [Bacillota bacterium]
MPNSAETIEKLSKQVERLILLEVAQECTTLEEFIEKLKAIVQENK